MPGFWTLAWLGRRAAAAFPLALALAFASALGGMARQRNEVKEKNTEESLE